MKIDRNCTLRYFLFIPLLLGTLVLKGQEYVLSAHYTDASDLPSNNITSMVSDKYGTFWFTCFSDLMSYNGVSFKHHPIDSDSGVNKESTAAVVYKTADGNICFHDGKRYYAIDENQQLIHLTQKNNSHFSEDFHPQDFSSHRVSFAYRLPEYQLRNLVKNHRNGYIIKENTIEYINYSTKHIEHKIETGWHVYPRGFMYSNGYLYVIGLQNITLKNGKVIARHTPMYWNDRLIAPKDISYIVSSNGTFYALILSLGLFKITPSLTSMRLERIIPADILPMLPKHEITFIHHLNDGHTLFVGTRLSGLYKYSKRMFEGYRHSLPLSPSFNSILQLGQSIHTNNGVKWDLTNNRASYSSLHFNVYSSDYVTDADNTRYFIRNEHFHAIKGDRILPPVTDNNYYYYSTGVVYKQQLHGWNGSIFFIKDHQKVVSLPFSIVDTNFEKNTYVSNQVSFAFRVHGTCMVNDTLWVGTTRGLYVFYKQQKISIPFPLSRDVSIRAIQADPHGRGVLLFTYGGGVFLYANGQFHQAAAASPKNLANTHYMFIDNLKRVWLATNRGMYCTDYETWFRSFTSPDTRPYYFYITTNEGLLSNELNGGTVHSCLYDTLTRKLYLSTVQGLNVFVPDSAALNIPNQPISIQEVFVDDQKLSGLSALPASFNILKLKVMSPYYGNKENLVIEYRIPQSSNSWVKLNNQNEMYLARGQSGHKTIELRYRNGFNEHDYRLATIPLYIAPLWYEKTVYQVLMVLLVFLSFWIILRTRVQLQKKKQVALQAIIAEQTQSLKHTLEELTLSEENLRSAITVKEKVIRVLAHDMRSPLVSTIYLTNHIQNTLKAIKEPDIHEPITLLDNVIQSQHSILNYANDFLAWYNVTNNMISLNIQEFSLNGVIGEILNMYRVVIELNANTLIYTPDEQTRVKTDKNFLTIIIRNLIDNANKNTLSGTIELQTRYTNGRPELVITNDAHHCDPASLRKLEETLNATTPHDPKDHKLGLILIKNLSVHLGIHVACRIVNNQVTISILF